jgi:hypothetical protein
MEFLPRNVQQYLAGWANLRANRNDRAIELLDAASQDSRWHASFLTNALKAIAHHQAGRQALAQTFLQRSNEDFLRFADSSDDAFERMKLWVDFVEGVVTNREANLLINGSVGATPQQQ